MINPNIGNPNRLQEIALSPSPGQLDGRFCKGSNGWFVPSHAEIWIAAGGITQGIIIIVGPKRGCDPVFLCLTAEDALAIAHTIIHVANVLQSPS